MRILIAPDSWKDAAAADEVAAAIARGLAAAMPRAELVQLPLADGGEGTAELLAGLPGTIRRELATVDALGRPTRAPVLGLPDGSAFVELASAAGLQALGTLERDPEATSTYGVGLLLREAISLGHHEVSLALGGSATQDLGLGLLRGLGFVLLDAGGEELAGTGADLARLAAVRRAPGNEAYWAAFAKTRFTLVCDVDNPALGERGTARTYAAQKGAAAAAVERLEAGGARAVSVLVAHRQRRLAPTQPLPPLASMPGGGAAGGVAVGLSAVADVRLAPGAPYVLAACGFDARLERADLVLTAEGSLDVQTGNGKLVAEVARRCAAAGLPCVALCGALGLGAAGVRALGLTAALPVGRGPRVLAEALADTLPDLERTAAQVGRLLSLGGLYPAGDDPTNASP